MADKIIYENYSKVFKSDHLRNLVTILFKRRLVILSVFFSVVILVTIGSFMMAPIFENIFHDIGRKRSRCRTGPSISYECS